MPEEPPFDQTEVLLADLQRSERAYLARVPERDYVPPTARRTMPPRPVDLAAEVPGLRALARPAVLLHPRCSDPPGPADSSVGGPLVWPADEPWPVCPEHHAPYLPIAQVRAADAPGITFRPGADLLQVLWCPRDHGWVDIVVRWRTVAGLPPADPPVPRLVLPAHVLRPCRLFPEPVTEYPQWGELPAEVRAEVAAALTGDRYFPRVKALWRDWDAAQAQDYDMYDAAVVPLYTGPKLGGWPNWHRGPIGFDCHVCGRPMDLLMQLCGGDGPVQVVEETAVLEEWERDPVGGGSAYRNAMNAPGFDFTGDGTVYLFVCRRCPDWSVRNVGQT